VLPFPRQVIFPHAELSHMRCARQSVTTKFHTDAMKIFLEMSECKGARNAGVFTVKMNQGQILGTVPFSKPGTSRAQGPAEYKIK